MKFAHVEKTLAKVERFITVNGIEPDEIIVVWEQHKKEMGIFGKKNYED